MAEEGLSFVVYLILIVLVILVVAGFAAYAGLIKFPKLDFFEVLGQVFDAFRQKYPI